MKRERYHTGDKEEEHRKELEVGAEYGTATSLALVLARQHALNYELVGTPVPETDHGRAYKSAEPRILRVGIAADKICHRVAVLVDLHSRADAHHFVPTAEFPKAEHEYDKRTQKQDRSLKNRCVKHRLHTTENSVKRCDKHKTHGGNPEEIDAPYLVDAEHLLEHEAAGIDCNGNFCQHIADKRNGGENGA
ncbi:hypothetical protein IMSAGC008_01960 [Muribaculaceae bacterium]|nr:hypothetical protein IMSAGC008_01960 [Muribaculaceae bacterium]